MTPPAIICVQEGECSRTRQSWRWFDDVLQATWYEYGPAMFSYCIASASVTKDTLGSYCSIALDNMLTMYTVFTCAREVKLFTDSYSIGQIPWTQSLSTYRSPKWAPASIAVASLHYPLVADVCWNQADIIITAGGIINRDNPGTCMYPSIIT